MILQVNNITKSYVQTDNKPVDVIKNINFNVKKGETISIVGPSGSGKTTLLSLIAGLDSIDSGSIILDGQDLSQLSEDKLSKYRSQKIGIVFQQFHLMPHLSVKENVRLPLEILNAPNISERTNEVLEQVGLSDKKTFLPAVLSGGECQRVAIARAMGIQPSILLADEPTGNLDNKTAYQIEELLFNLVESINMTLVVVTHNLRLANHCERQLQLKEGQLYENLD
ncbi:MAG: ABC transporter ATP-binding protein [Deltaproteobacteria bacterium]|jgi:putative ABC transport system ATP-binding protein|nr:ABC transporter ATP-binding protein [Deltaproteobacteria bacterium]MBT4526724.1 ABC transporter ATP-binding protein [Deltaproteobacteria bacterium]